MTIRITYPNLLHGSGFLCFLFSELFMNVRRVISKPIELFSGFILTEYNPKKGFHCFLFFPQSSSGLNPVPVSCCYGRNAENGKLVLPRPLISW